MPDEIQNIKPINLSLKEAACYLGISPRYLNEIKCQKINKDNNDLVRYIKVGKRVLFPIEELDDFNRRTRSRQWEI